MKISIGCAKSPAGCYKWHHSRIVCDQATSVEYIDESIYTWCKAVVRIDLEQPTSGVMVIVLGVAENDRDETLMDNWIGVYTEDQSSIDLTLGKEEGRMTVRHDITISTSENQEDLENYSSTELDEDPVKCLAGELRGFQGSEKRKVLQFVVKNTKFCTDVLNSLAKKDISKYRKSDGIVLRLLGHFVALIEDIKKDIDRQTKDLLSELNKDVLPDDPKLRELARNINCRAPRHRHSR